MAPQILRWIFDSTRDALLRTHEFDWVMLERSTVLENHFLTIPFYFLWYWWKGNCIICSCVRGSLLVYC
jgi:hypothetical protein